MTADFTQLDRVLQHAGYVPGPPSAEVAAQDEGVCARMACSVCGSTGVEYHPYVPRSGSAAGAYRAFAVCRACRRAAEF